MNNNSPIQLYSEVGRLRKVMLHRPGKELENLVPDYLEHLLFDEIPFLEEAQKEHDNFAALLRDLEVEVLYLEELASEVLNDPSVKQEFINDWLIEAGINDDAIQEWIRNDLNSYDKSLDLVLKTMEGYRKSELPIKILKSTQIEDPTYPFIVDPMPSLYFTRDTFSTIGNGVSLNRMFAKSRQRENIYIRYIFNYHSLYNHSNIPIIPMYLNDSEIEGGDILILSQKLLAIGCSQRTSMSAIEQLGQELLENTSFDEILVFSIANVRKYMHLDTVFTMVDYDKFVYHPDILNNLELYSIKKDNNQKLVKTLIQQELSAVLAEKLDVEEITLIKCGGDDPVAAAREQWNDGANTLAIAPGEVIVYDRNRITNAELEKNGIKLYPIKGSELVRGRGGPRCMSMPFYRDK